jgi:hypothetical protein
LPGRLPTWRKTFFQLLTSPNLGLGGDFANMTAKGKVGQNATLLTFLRFSTLNF